MTFKTGKGEEHLCPRRAEGVLPAFVNSTDAWEMRGGDRVCSFCGSLHPEDFMKFCQDVPSNDGYMVEPSTKSYKIYIRRPHIKNAGQGAIKFYTQHLQGLGEQWLAELQGVYGEALKLSGPRMRAMLEEAKERLRNEDSR